MPHVSSGDAGSAHTGGSIGGVSSRSAWSIEAACPSLSLGVSSTSRRNAIFGASRAGNSQYGRLGGVHAGAFEIATSPHLPLSPAFRPNLSLAFRPHIPYNRHPVNPLREPLCGPPRKFRNEPTPQLQLPFVAVLCAFAPAPALSAVEGREAPLPL
jgi:hypothetical protein